jgi:hypothetical protein
MVTNGSALLLNPKIGLGAGRTSWAHFEFTRINIEPIILRKKIEDWREAGAVVLCSSIRSVSATIGSTRRRERPFFDPEQII